MIYLYSEDFADRFNYEQGLDDTTLVDLNDTTTWMTEFVALFVGSPLEEHNINESDFYNNGYGALKDAIKAYAEEELNGIFEFYMEYDSEGFLVDELKEERIIKAKAQDKLDYQLFRIYSVTKNHENDNYIIRAQHITYDLANNFVEELKVTDISKKQVMESIGNNATRPHPFNLTSTNNSTRSSTSLYRTNPLQMVAGMQGSVLQVWGGQLERDNFNLIMHDRRGSDDGVSVTYEKNITGLDATFDISSLITRIYPFVLIDATDDDPERLITVDGKYIDSPLINTYSQVYIEPIDYSHDDRIDIQDKTDAEIRSQLNDVAKEHFNETGNDKAKATLDVRFAHLWETEEYKDVAPLELIGMGDTVTINHSKLKVDATAIVNYIRYDCIAMVNEEVKLGSVKARFSDSINKIDRIEKEVEKTQDEVNKVIVSANGKNTTYYGPDEPTGKLIKGDLWFRIVDGEYTRTYRFDGIQWQLIMDMDSQEAKAEAEGAKDRADDAYERANKGVSDAQKAFDKAQENADEVDTLALRIGDNEKSITKITGTAEGLQLQVEDNEDNIATLTITSEVFQSVLGGIVDKRNLLPFLEDGNINSEGKEVDSGLSVRSPFIKVDPNGQYSKSVDGEPLNAYISYYDKDKNFIRRSFNTGLVFYTDSDVEYIRVSLNASNVPSDKVQIEEGPITEYVPYVGTSQSVISQLSDSVNLRVEKDDIINQINISEEGVLISGEKLILDGDTTINGDFLLDGSANIKDASIGTAQIGTIDAAQASIINVDADNITSGTIDADLITVHGGSETNYMTIDGSDLITHGVFTRTWGGVTDTARLRLGLFGGRVRITNDDTGYNLYMTEKGLSTTMSGASDISAGTIEFHSQRYNEVSRGVTIHSTYGAVALVSDYSTAVIDVNRSINLNSTDSNVYIRPMTDARSGTNEFIFRVKDNTWQNSDGWISFGDISTGTYHSGLRFSKNSGSYTIYATNGNGDIGTGRFDADTFRGTLVPRGTNNYLRAVLTRFVMPGSSTTNYADVQFKHGRANTIRVNDSGANFYIGTSTGEVRITTNELSSGSYRPIRARDFITDTSLRENKRNIDVYDLDVLDTIRQTDAYLYNRSSDPSYTKKQLGLMIDELPYEVLSERGDAFGMYSLVTFLFRGLKQAVEKIDTLEGK